MATTPKLIYFSGETGDGTTKPDWSVIEAELRDAEMYWITSLQDGEPHTVPVIGTWWEGALYSCNPRSEQHYKNLQQNSVCQALTGCSKLNEGFDIAVHGRVEEVPEMEGRLRFAAQMAEKYPEPWRFQGTEEDMWVYRLIPTHIRAFHRFNPLTLAKWEFS